jgi:RNA polymerase sigma factor (sigma-70 family)
MNAELELPAVAEFFGEERGRLVGYVRGWVGDIAEEEAEDIVQEVALNVLNIFAQGDVTAPIRNLAGYVYRALKNSVVDYLRLKKPTLSLDTRRGGEGTPSLADLLKDEAIAPESQVEQNELHRRLYRALNALAAKDRAIIIATEFEGRTFQDLAEEWDVPLGTLLTRKARALKKVRKYLEASDKFLTEGGTHVS